MFSQKLIYKYIHILAICFVLAVNFFAEIHQHFAHGNEVANVACEHLSSCEESLVSESDADGGSDDTCFECELFASPVMAPHFVMATEATIVPCVLIESNIRPYKGFLLARYLSNLEARGPPIS